MGRLRSHGSAAPADTPCAATGFDLSGRPDQPPAAPCPRSPLRRAVGIEESRARPGQSEVCPDWGHRPAIPLIDPRFRSRFRREWDEVARANRLRGQTISNIAAVWVEAHLQAGLHFVKGDRTNDLKRICKGERRKSKLVLTINQSHVGPDATTFLVYCGRPENTPLHAVYAPEGRDEYFHACRSRPRYAATQGRVLATGPPSSFLHPWDRSPATVFNQACSWMCRGVAAARATPRSSQWLPSHASSPPGSASAPNSRSMWAAVSS